MESNNKENNWRDIIREGLLEGHTPVSRFFDFVLLILILLSVVAVILETIPFFFETYGVLFFRFEILFTIVFTIEYFLRLITTKKPLKFAFSFSGIIDFLSILPLYLVLLGVNQTVGLIRVLRLLRIGSRILRLSKDFSHTMHFSTHIKDQLAPNEKLLLYFKRSRKRFIFGYLLIVILLSFSTFQIIFNYFQNVFMNVSGYIIFVFALFLFFKYEIKTIYERYAITNHRVIRSRGILHEDFKGTTYRFIADVLLYRSFSDKVLGIGSVLIKTTGREKTGNLELTSISNPAYIKNAIHHYMMESHKTSVDKSF